mgnify:CR=1 FL=1
MLKIKKRLITKLFIFTCIFVILTTLFKFNNRGNQGDQVHFQVITSSIINDFDFNIKNNYQPKIYSDFYKSDTALNYHILDSQFNNDSKSWYSLHNPGLSLLIVPIVLLFGYGYEYLLMCFFSTLLILNTYKWAYAFTKDKKNSKIASFLFSISLIFISLNGYIFPNIIIALMTLNILFLFLKEDKNDYDLLKLSFLLGLGPWIHVKTLLTYAIIGFWSVIDVYKDNTKNYKVRLCKLILPSFILIALFEICLYKWYGVFLPSSTFAGDSMFKVSPIMSFLAQLFDSGKGLFINNPIFLLLPVGIPIMYSKFKDKTIKILCIILPSFILQLTFKDWWGGWSPSNRYLIEILPVFIPSLTLALNIRDKYFRVITKLLALSTFFVSFIYMYGKSGWFLPGNRNPFIIAMENYTGINLDLLIVKFNPDLTIQSGKIVIIFWLILFFLLIYYGSIHSKRHTSIQP